MHVGCRQNTNRHYELKTSKMNIFDEFEKNVAWGLLERRRSNQLTSMYEKCAKLKVKGRLHSQLHCLSRHLQTYNWIMFFWWVGLTIKTHTHEQRKGREQLFCHVFTSSSRLVLYRTPNARKAEEQTISRMASRIIRTAKQNANIKNRTLYVRYVSSSFVFPHYRCAENDRDRQGK